jgi:hypothetical protein
MSKHIERSCSRLPSQGYRPLHVQSIGAALEPGSQLAIFLRLSILRRWLEWFFGKCEIFRVALKPFPETGEYPSGFDSPASFSKDSHGLAEA